MSTGKTQAVMTTVASLLERGVAPSEICVVTFTRIAAHEISHRMVRRFPQYSYDDFPWVGTIHSICCKLIGVPQGHIFNGKPAAEFTHLYPQYRYSNDIYWGNSDPSELEMRETMLVTIGDWYEHFDSRRRNAMISFDEQLKHFISNNGFLRIPQMWSKRTQDLYCERKAQFLQENGYFDFNALLETVIKRQLRPAGIRYLFSDESQDNSPLLWTVLDQWAEGCEKYVCLGDPDQCLPAGTKISTPDGERRIEDIQEGDTVLSAAGKGYVAQGKVSAVFSKMASEMFVSLTFEGGGTIELTVDHKVFVFIDPAKDDLWYVYLMNKKGIGWRVGISKVPIGRFRLERTADSLLAIQACQSLQEARLYESYYSLKYGIPTSVFYSRQGISTAWFTSRLNSMLDVETRVRQLCKDIGLSLDFPQHRRGAFANAVKRRTIVNVRMCDTEVPKHPRHDRRTWHSLIMETSDEQTLKRLEAAGYMLTPGRKTKCRRIRKVSQDLGSLYDEACRIAAITDSPINLTAQLACRGKGKIGDASAVVTTAGNILPGFYIPVLLAGKIEYKRVQGVQRQMKMEQVYDLNVDHYHNYIANGVVVHNCIYSSFLPASPERFLRFVESARRIDLVQSHRLPRKIQAVSEDWISRNQERVQRAFKPRPEDGIAQGFSNLEQFDWADLAMNRGNSRWKAFLLARTRKQAKTMKHWLRDRGIPYATNRGNRNPLQTSVGDLACAFIRLLEGEAIRADDLKGINRLIPAKPWLQHGAKSKFLKLMEEEPHRLVDRAFLSQAGFTSLFLDALTPEGFPEPLAIPDTHKSYLRRCYHHYGREAFMVDPTILVTNIHGVKGMEADVVIINPNLTGIPARSYFDAPEEERRVGYVGITRAKEALYVLAPDQTKQHYDFKATETVGDGMRQQ